MRTRLPELYRETHCLGKLSPLGLRRLIGIRSWLPAAERPGMDALIEAARRAGIASAPLPRAEPIGMQASPFDGSGAQAAWLAVKDGRRYRIESVLVKQGDGVREAFSQRDLTKRELDGMGRRMSDASGTIRVDADYLNRMIRHFIAVGLDRGAPPPPRLVSTKAISEKSHTAACLSFRPPAALRKGLHSATMRPFPRLAGKRKSGAIWYKISRQPPNEWAAGGYWTPERISTEDEIERLKATDPGAFSPERTRRVLVSAGNWPTVLDFAASWFEDDARVETLLHEHIGAAGRWLKHLPHAASVIMQAVAERSVQSAWQRSFRR